MTSELILCPICKKFYELLYVNSECVGQTKCDCKSKDKNIDKALKQLAEVLNG